MFVRFTAESNNEVAVNILQVTRIHPSGGDICQMFLTDGNYIYLRHSFEEILRKITSNNEISIQLYHHAIMPNGS